MILVDTSVWVEHFRRGDIGLEQLLADGRVLCHPFIIGELACGSLRNRAQILALLNRLPMGNIAADVEVLHFIEKNRLMGKGLGYVDMHLLASATLSHVQLWTLDKKLNKTAAAMKLNW